MNTLQSFDSSKRGDDENYIEDFEVVRQIGSGSFSNVFLCKREASMVTMEEMDDLFIIKEINTNRLVKKYISESRIKFNRKNRFKKNCTLPNNTEDVKGNTEDIKGNTEYIKGNTGGTLQINDRAIKVHITPYQNDILINTEQEYYYKRLYDLIKSEIEILSNLDNSHIVKFYRWSKTNSIYYLRMEYCDGGDLFEYVKKNGNDFQFDASKINFLYTCIYQVSSGLKYLHEKNIIHRDIKLQNILIKNSYSGIEFKISDFGFACYDLSDSSFDYDDKSILFKKYFKLCGTPYYMAPEIILNMNTYKKSGVLDTVYCYTKNVDIWSFGICIYELVFGGFPFNDVYNVNSLEKFYSSDNVEKNIHLKITKREIITDNFKSLLIGMLTVDNNKRHNIDDVVNKVGQITNTDIYKVTDLEKEMCDIINCEENMYFLEKELSNKLQSRLDIHSELGEVSWQQINTLSTSYIHDNENIFLTLYKRYMYFL